MGEEESVSAGTVNTRCTQNLGTAELHSPHSVLHTLLGLLRKQFLETPHGKMTSRKSRSWLRGSMLHMQTHPCPPVAAAAWPPPFSSYQARPSDSVESVSALQTLLIKANYKCFPLVFLFEDSGFSLLDFRHLSV